MERKESEGLKLLSGSQRKPPAFFVSTESQIFFIIDSSESNIDSNDHSKVG